MEKNIDTKEIAKLLGKQGGLKTLQNRGTNHYKDMAKKSAEVRRKKALSPDSID